MCDRFGILAAMTTEKFNRQKLETQLDELRTEVRELLRKLETTAGKEAEALRPKLKTAQDRLHELRQTGAEAWHDLKPGLEKAWEELHKSLSQAASRFKTGSKL